MKRFKKITNYIFISFTFLLLLLFPDISSNGVKIGINILLYSLIPAILPLMIFSNYLIKSGYSLSIGKAVHPIFSRIFHTSLNGSYAVIVGFLCGYPIGAKIINDLVLDDKISTEEGNYLLGFINNPSPAFIQGYVLSLICIPHGYRFLILMMTYLPSIITGMIMGYNKKNHFTDSFTGRVHYPMSKIIDDCIFDSIITIMKLSGYIIIFSIISTFIYCIPFIPNCIKMFFVCIPEITSGIHYITSFNIPIIIKLFLSLLLSISGGLSITFQIKSVISKTDLSIRHYLKCRLITMLIFILIFMTFTAFPNISDSLFK